MRTSKCPSIQIINISSPSNGKRKLRSFSAYLSTYQLHPGCLATKLLKPVVGFLRQISCRLIIYVPGRPTDYASGQNSVGTNYPTDLSTIREFRINSHFKKSILTPTQKLEFLGFQLCSIAIRVSLPSEKIRKIQQDAERMML